MAGWLADVFDHQIGLMDIEIWMEPFAGGAGAGLGLLTSDQVQEVWLVEKHPGIAALWRTIITDGQRFAARVADTRPDMDVWQHARHLLESAQTGKPVDDFDLGWAAFIVNRCSRSGIVDLRAGPIGGRHQAGRYKIGDRYHPDRLAARISDIGHYGKSRRLQVWEGDATDRITSLNRSGIGDELMMFVDPPYVAEGNGLYHHGMGLDDHRRLAAALRRCRTPWLLTYDAHPAVPSWYPKHRILYYTIPHTANQQGTGAEYAVFSDNLWLPDGLPQPTATSTAVWHTSEQDLRQRRHQGERLGARADDSRSGYPTLLPLQPSLPIGVPA